jgi:hypothetical protein
LHTDRDARTCYEQDTDMTDLTVHTSGQHSPALLHAPHAHADTTGMHYTCTACTYTTPHVPLIDPAAAEAILRHCGHPVRRIPAGTIGAARTALHDAELLLRRRRLGYSRAWRTKHRHASAAALIRAAGGAL